MKICVKNLKMKYKLINKTDIPTDKVKELIEFVCPRGVDNFCITLMDDVSGAAWWGDTTAYKKVPSIRLYIAKYNKYPRLSNPRTTKSSGYTPQFWLRNREETILALLAHELRHIWQVKVSKKDLWRTSRMCKYVLWDNKTYTSLYSVEKDACKYARDVLHKYRKIKKL